MSIVIGWYLEHGQHPADVTECRTESPWYVTKTELSFEDTLVQLHRVVIATPFCPFAPLTQPPTAPACSRYVLV
jgi:hypothetical protein